MYTKSKRLILKELLMFVSNWLLSKSTRLPKEINKWDSEQWISHHDLHSIFYLERKGSDRVIKKQAEFSSVSGRSSLPFEDLFRMDCERSWMCAISKCEFYSEQVTLLQIIYRVSHSRAPSLVLNCRGLAQATETLRSFCKQSFRTYEFLTWYSPRPSSNRFHMHNLK